MKQDIDNLEQTYKLCKSSGKIKEKEIDVDLIKSIYQVSKQRLNFINKQKENLNKDSFDWTFVFVDYYESLRGLIEAILLFHGYSADNHQCKNALICHKYKDLDWEFLEIIRLKRNYINYRGIMLKYNNWKQFELSFKLHIKNLEEEINKRLKDKFTINTKNILNKIENGENTISEKEFMGNIRN